MSKQLSHQQQYTKDMQRYVMRRLKHLGIGPFERCRSEARMLPQLLHENESIGSAVAGRGDKGHYMMIATDRRVIVVDAKPLFSTNEDISYYFVAGVSEGQIGAICTLKLHTRLEDFTIVTSNLSAAKQFKRYIDDRIIEHELQRLPNMA